MLFNNDSLMITVYQPMHIDEKLIQYAERTLLDKGKELLQPISNIDDENDKKMLIDNFTFSLMDLFIDYNDFTFKDNVDYFFSSDKNSINFSYLFSYYSCKPQDLEKTEESYADLYTPFTYYRFITEFVDMVSFLPQKDDVKRHKNLTDLVQYVIFNTPDLINLSSFDDLRKVMRRYLKKELNVTDFSFFTNLFDECRRKAIIYPTKLNEDVRLRHDVRKIVNINKNDLNKLIPLTTQGDNTLSIIRFLHDRGSYIKENWVYKDEEIEEDPKSYQKEAVKRLRYTSLVVSVISYEKQPNGNAHVLININQISPKNEKKEMQQENEIFAFKLEAIIKYFGKKEKIKFSDLETEMVLPIYKKKDVKIRFIDPNKKGSILYEMAIPPLTENQNIKGEFKIKGYKYIVTINTVAYGKSNIVPVKKHKFGTECNPTKCVQALLDLLMHKWFEKDMGEKPPMEYYNFLCDFCLKYSIPANYVFMALLSKMQNCWTTSGAFLEAYTPVFLTCYSLAQNRKLTDMEKDNLHGIFKQLKTKISQILLNTLSKLDIIEKPSITELLLILSIIKKGEWKEKSDYFHSILQDSSLHIFESILSVLKPIHSKKEATSSALSLFSVVDQKDFVPEMGPNGIPMVDFDVESLIESARILLQRSEKLNAFFTQAVLPKFADSQEMIQGDFSSLAIKIATVFVERVPRPPEEATFRFLNIYKQIFRFIWSSDADSPEKIFMPILVHWVSEFGPTIIQWANNTLKYDNFEVLLKSSMVSSTVIDLFRIFNETVSFLEEMGFPENSMRQIYTTYISLCSSSVKHAIASFMTILDTRTYSLLYPRAKLYDSILVTPKQAFVIINDIFYLKEQWTKFETKFTAKHQVDGVPDPLVGFASTINAAIRGFEIQSLLITKSVLVAKLWPHKNQRKAAAKSFSFPIFFNHNSAKEMEKDQSSLDSAVIPEMLNDFISKINELLDGFDLIYHSFQTKYIRMIFSGIETGFCESLFPFFKEMNFVVYKDIISSFYNAVNTLISNLQEKLQNKAFSEIGHLQWASKIIEKPFQSLLEADIPNEDIKTAFFQALTLTQMASTKEEKKKAAKLSERFKDFSFIDPKDISMKEPKLS